MGRGRIKIKRIENLASRQVTVLCDAQVSLVVFSSTDKISKYCSPSTSLVKILDQYQKASGRKLWDAKLELYYHRPIKMGRGRIEIKRIENSASSQVTYSKRRTGLLKKASEITVLCDAQVSLVIFSSTGKISEYCSPSTSLVKILDQYQKASGRKLWDAKLEVVLIDFVRVICWFEKSSGFFFSLHLINQISKTHS